MADLISEKQSCFDKKKKITFFISSLYFFPFFNEYLYNQQEKVVNIKKEKSNKQKILVNFWVHYGSPGTTSRKCF